MNKKNMFRSIRICIFEICLEKCIYLAKDKIVFFFAMLF